MRLRLFEWLGEEFVALETQASEGDAVEQTRDVLARVEDALAVHGLTLADTVRTRLWARDRLCRDQGSRERYRILSGPARSVSSSYIAPQHFSTPSGLIGIDVVAMRHCSRRKRAVEREPAAVPLRYLICGRACFLSGVTSPSGELEEQVAAIIPTIGATLAHAGLSWDRVVRVAAFLHRSQSIHELRRLLEPHIASASLVIGIVEGYSSAGKLVEVEVTARGR